MDSRSLGGCWDVLHDYRLVTPCNINLSRICECVPRLSDIERIIGMITTLEFENLGKEDFNFFCFNGSGYEYSFNNIKGSRDMGMIAFRVKPSCFSGDDKKYVKIPKLQKHHLNFPMLNKSEHPKIKRVTKSFNVFCAGGQSVLFGQMPHVLKEKVSEGKLYTQEELEKIDGITIEAGSFLWDIHINF